MLPKDHQAAVQRALALGRSGDPTALPELVALLRLPSHEIQRLAASAIGKLISVHLQDLPGLDGLLPAKLRQYGCSG